MSILGFISSLLASQSNDIEEKCDFRCWFRKLKITIDKIHTNFSQTFVVHFAYDLDIFNLTLYNMDLINIKASYYPNPNVIEDGILLDVTMDADMKCALELKETEGILGVDVTGSMEADVKRMSMKLPLIIKKGKDGLIESVSVGDICSGHIEDMELEIKTSSALIGWLLDLLKSTLKSYIMENIGSLICQYAPIGDSITKGFAMANDIIRPFLNESVPIVIPVGPNMADLRKSVIVDVGRFFLTQFIGIDGPLNLNSIFNRFTNNTGTFHLTSVTNYFGLKFPVCFTIPIQELNSYINISINEFNFSGMNSWSDFTFFEPIDNYTLDTHTGMTDLGINSSFTINVSTNGSMINTGDSYLSEDANLILHMKNNSMDFLIQVASPEGTGLNYTSPQALDLNCIKKFLSPNGTGMTFIKFKTDIDVIRLEAAKEDLEIEIRTFINNLVQFFITNYEHIIPVFLNSIINDYVVPMANNMLDSVLEGGDCSYTPEYPYHQFIYTTTFSAVAVGVLFTSIMLIIVCYLQKKKEKINGLNSGMLNSLNSVDYTNNNRSFLLDDSDNASLLMTSKLPLFVRIFIPFLIFMNIALFFSSNTGIGASVFIKFKIGKKLVSLPSLFNFGLINSIKDMWEGKAYALSILIAVMSCAWPYTKLVLMLLAWILPMNILSKKRRESILKILDALGKWSLLDSYVMILMLVAFHFDLKFKNVSKEVNGNVIIDLWVFPAYGFVALMIGTVFSLGLSHIILALERHVDKSINDSSRNKSRVSLFRFCKKRFLSILVVFLLILSIGTLLAGVIFKSFSFKFVGLLGWAMNLLETPYYQEYSVLDLAYLLPQSAEAPKSFGIKFTQALYVIVTVIMPLLHTITLLIFWTFPLRQHAQVILYKACEIMYAWSCLDVFVISIAAAVLEISQFAQFMVGNKCDLINPIVHDYFKDEPLIKNNEKCFQVITVLLRGSYTLLAATIVHTISTIVINIVARRILEERASNEN